MADPFGVRNVVVQSSMVEKIQQVQQQQGDLQQRYLANPNQEEAERKKVEVKSSAESAGAKVKEKKEEEEKKRKERQAHKVFLSPDGKAKDEKEIDSEDSGLGIIVDVKV